MSQPILSLDARYYTDPKIFEIETRGLLSRTWQFGCHASDIPAPGSYICFEIAGESLFAVRDRESEIRVFYNVCQHRAHQLLKGKGRAPSIVCPYHAWSYNMDGTLLATPNLDVVDGVDTSSI